MKINRNILAGLLTVMLSSTALAQGSDVPSLTAATSPLPATSCFYVAEWNGSAYVDRNLCSNYPLSIGAAPNTRSIGTGGLLTGGGNLTADRTISIASQAACTIVANATTGPAAPAAVSLGTGLSCSGGQIVATGSGLGDVVGPAGVTDNMIAAFDGTTGKLIKSSGVLVSGLAVPGGTTGAIQYRSAGGAFAGVVITGLVKGNDTSAPSAAVSGTDYAPATSGTSILKGSGVGGFLNAVSGTDYAPATSGTSILKGSGTGGFSNAVSSTDYAPPTSGTSILKGNNTGGFAAAVASTDYAPPTSGTAILKGNNTGGFANAVASTDYAPATSGTSILKGNNTGGFANAVSSTDYAPATSGTALLKGNNTGGFANAVASTDYAPATSGTAVLRGNGTGGFAAAVDGTDFSLITGITCTGTDKLSAVTAAGTFTCTTDATGAGSISVTDGVTNVNPATSISFNATQFDITDGGAGIAQVKQITTVRTITGTTGTIDATDEGKTIRTTNAGTVTLSIGTAAATLGANFNFYLECDGAGGCVVDPNLSELIDGDSTLTVSGETKAYIATDATVWRAAVFSSKDPSNASNLTSGAVSTARGGAGAVNGMMRADGTGQVSAATPGTHYAAATTGSANTPLFNNGSGGFTNGTRSGNTTSVATTSGTFVNGNCAKFDVSGNIVDHGAACGGSGAPGGTNGAIQYNSSGSFGGAVITGIVKGNGTSAPNAAILGTDYAGAPTGGVNTPLFNNGSGGFTNGTRSGNTTSVATTSGTLVNGNCARFDVSGNIVDHGATCGTGGSVSQSATIGWVAGVNPDKSIIMIADGATTVTSIRGRVGDAVGTAATVAIYKAADGTACTSVAATIQHSGTLNANGTANDSSTLTLVGGNDNILAAGDVLCLVTTGGSAWTSGVGIGGITVTYTRS